MTLILGAYSRNESIRPLAVSEMLQDFTLQYSRVIHKEITGKLLMASTTEAVERTGNIARLQGVFLRVVFGGKIRNLNEITRILRRKGWTVDRETEPAEVMIRAYQEWGPTFTDRLQGAFALALYDEFNDTLVLTNDKWGRYPMFVYISTDWVTFSSEFQPISKSPGFDDQLDYNAIAEYLVLGQTIADKTFFLSIRNLPPGSTMLIRRDSESTVRRKKFSVDVDYVHDIEFFAERAAEIVRCSVQERFQDPDISVWNLTGGVDTRLYLGSLTSEQRKDIEFVSAHSPFLAVDVDTDTVVARMLADKFELTLKIVQARPGIDFDLSYFTRNRPSGNPSMSLQGHYGGEHLGAMCLMEEFALANMTRDGVGTIANNLLSREFLRQVRNPFDTLRDELGKQEAENSIFLLCIQQMGRCFFGDVYSGSRGGWVMPHKFPLVVDSIFWDEELIDLLLTVPMNLLSPYVLYHEMYKNHFPELTEIPTNNVLISRVPGSTMTVIKQGTNPKSICSSKYRTALNTYMASNETWEKDLYNQSFLRQCSDENMVETRRFIDFEAWFRAHTTGTHCL